jgi:hypothetical protein
MYPALQQTTGEKCGPARRSADGHRTVPVVEVGRLRGRAHQSFSSMTIAVRAGSLMLCSSWMTPAAWKPTSPASASSVMVLPCGVVIPIVPVLVVTADKRNIAPSKAWEGGIPCERMKPFKRIQLVKVQSG